MNKPIGIQLKKGIKISQKPEKLPCKAFSGFFSYFKFVPNTMKDTIQPYNHTTIQLYNYTTAAFQ